MSSPFPGMDPYLEEPIRWGGVHSRLINSISDMLTRLVSPKFFVEIEEKVYITGAERDDERWIVPDVYLAAHPLAPGSPSALASAITEPTLIEPMDFEEVRDRYIEIYDAESRAVVTVLEVLSPFNKAAGSVGRRAFMWKRKTVMASQVHWIEIDLLRAGERPDEVKGRSDYYALLKRGNTTRPYAAWLFNLREALPTLAVPLRPPFEDAPLDLRAALEDVYVRGDYAAKMDYSRLPPPPRLRPPNEAWAKECVDMWLTTRAT